MNKLFVLSYARILQRLAATEITAANANELLAKNNLAQTSEALLYRLPRQELKHILNIPCPINNLEQASASEIINSSKLLRSHVKYNEEKICGKCSLVQKCPSSKKSLENVKYQNPTKDLLLYFSGLNSYMQPDNIYYRQWVSAYRLGDSIISCIDDLAQGGKQIEEYQRIRQQGLKQAEAKGQSSSNEAKEQVKAKKLEEKLNKSKPKTQNKKEEVIPDDFSFDQEQVFEPTKKSTKPSWNEQKTKKQPLKNYKGYQKIQESQDDQPFSQRKEQKTYKTNKPSNFNRDQQYQNKKSYSKEGQSQFKKPRRQEYTKNYSRQDTNNNRSQYSNFNKGDRQYNNQSKQYNSNPRDRQSSRPYSATNNFKRQSNYSNDNSDYPRKNKSNFNTGQKNKQENWRNDDRRGSSRQQSNYGSNSKIEQKQYKFQRKTYKNNNSNDDQADDSPKIREYANKNKQTYETQPPKKTVKANPFIEKWNADPFEDSISSKPKSNSSQLRQNLNRTSAKSQPRIVSIQSIEESGQRTGRNIQRRRRTTTEQSVSEQK